MLIAFIAGGSVHAGDRIAQASSPATKALNPVSADIQPAPSRCMATLITTAKLNNVDPLAWLADMLARIACCPHSRLHGLLPWEN